MRGGFWHGFRSSLLLLIVLASEARAQSPSQPRPLSSGRAAAALADGWTRLQAGQLKEAKASFEAALAQDPASAEAHYLLGFVFEREKELQSAVSSYETAIRYAPDLAEARDRLGLDRKSVV